MSQNGNLPQIGVKIKIFETTTKYLKPLPNSTQWYICHITGMGLLVKTYRVVVPRIFPTNYFHAAFSFSCSPNSSLSFCLYVNLYRLQDMLWYTLWAVAPWACPTSYPGVTPWVGGMIGSGHSRPGGTEPELRRPPTRDKATPTEAGPKGGWVGRKFLSQFWIKFLSQNLAWMCTDDSCVPKPTKLNTMIHLSHHRHGATS